MAAWQTVRKRDWPIGLICFWVVIITTIGGGAGYLQYLGPPAPPAALLVKPSIATAAPKLPQPKLPLQPKPAASVLAPPQIAKPAAPAPVPPPKPAAPPATPKVLTTTAASPLPAAPNAAPPIPAYSASLAPPPVSPAAAPDAPRIALMVSGLGDDDTLSLVAASTLPPEISFALSPYGKHLQLAAAAARANGHETLLLLPMPGLIAKAPVAQNQAMLDWSLSQMRGFTGVTDAYGPALGGGFMNDKAAKSWLMSNLARRNLFFIEGSPLDAVSPFTWGRSADVVIDADDPDNEASELSLLVTEAQAQHSALGIVVAPNAETLQAIALWSQSLANQNIQLVPVSALVQPPETSLMTQASTAP